VKQLPLWFGTDGCNVAMCVVVTVMFCSDSCNVVMCVAVTAMV
jgi:hypothetical protein